MVSRLLCMQKVPGSIPGPSIVLNFLFELEGFERAAEGWWSGGKGAAEHARKGSRVQDSPCPLGFGASSLQVGDAVFELGRKETVGWWCSGIMFA